jgi:small subunit ribosomal protein S3Ae
MAGKTKKVKAIDKWRRKRFFPILAPKAFQERELGQTMAYEPAELNRRCISCNLMMLTGNIKRQNINVTFRVNKVQGDTAFTIFERYEVVPAAIKRKVRRQKDRVDASFQSVTKDNKLLRIKPMLVTSTQVSRAVKSAVRKALVAFMLTSIRAVDYDTLVIDIINEKFQRDIWGALNRITPIKSVDIRIMKYLGEHTGEFTVPAFVQKAFEKKVEKKAEEEVEAEEAPAEEETQEETSEESEDETASEA